MDKWKYYAITHHQHLLCNSMMRNVSDHASFSDSRVRLSRALETKASFATWILNNGG